MSRKTLFDIVVNAYKVLPVFTGARTIKDFKILNLVTSAIASNNTSIVNPFGSPDTRKVQIVSEISKSIDSLANMEFRLVAVHYDFDPLITDRSCDAHPRLR